MLKKFVNENNEQSPWNIEQVEADLRTAFEENSELELLATIKDNSFLLYELYTRKHGIQPAFREVEFGR